MGLTNAVSDEALILIGLETAILPAQVTPISPPGPPILSTISEAEDEDGDATIENLEDFFGTRLRPGSSARRFARR